MLIPMTRHARHPDEHRTGRELSSVLEDAIESTLAHACEAGPAGLRRAVRHAVIPGGSRLRPLLTLEVARAIGADPEDPAVLAAAVAVELFHCASLVHDDLPCFDDASVRRGRPSVHAAFGQALAVLAGDALIVAGFEVVASSPFAGALTARFARALGASRGLIAGQGWESEPVVDVATYHRAKTGALFEAATAVGAIVAGGRASDFAVIGERFGEAYQVLDDIADTHGSGSVWGKRLGRDEELTRPNAVLSEGLAMARERCVGLLSSAVASVPECPGRSGLVRFLDEITAATLAKALPTVDATGTGGD